MTTVIGIDISKNKIDVADNQDSTAKTVGNYTKELTQWINSIADKTVTIVVMEATGGYESLLVELLHKNDIALAVVNPRRVCNFAIGIGRDAKTDPIDAGVLVRFGEVVKPSPQLVQSEEQIKLGVLVERRRQIVDLINQEQNRSQQTRDKEIRKSIVAELPELGKLNRQQIAKLAGVAPINNDSGQSIGKRKTAGGRSGVRRTLYMATLVATRFNPRIKEYYQRLLAKGKVKKVALTAAMRKLLTILNTLVSTDQLWIDPVAG